MYGSLFGQDVFQADSAMLQIQDSEKSETIVEAISLAASALLSSRWQLSQPDEDLWQLIRTEGAPGQMSAILQDQDSSKFKIILGALSLAARALSS